jgi:hypothetical protein
MPTGVGANTDYLNIGQEDLTVEASVYIAQGGGGATGHRPILEKRIENGITLLGYTMFLSYGRLGFQVARSPTEYHNIFSPGQLALGTWVHVAAVVKRRPPEPSPRLTLYVGGQQVNQENELNAWFLGPLRNSSLARIGRHTSATQFFEGHLKDLCVYTRALSGTEIMGLAARPKSGGRVP